MQRLLWLRSRWSVASVRLRWRLVVRIVNHMAVWWSLERRLTGVHGVPADLSASEMQTRVLDGRGQTVLSE
jgi:hypothetical protein